MVYKIVVGRNQRDREKYGEQGTVPLGRHYVHMGQTTSLSNPVFLDVNTSHVVLVSGKRGGGKSYSLASIAEEMTRLPKEVADNISILMFDTMGIFWTMKYPNTRQEKLLEEWNLKPEGLDIQIQVPEGHYEEYKEKGIPVDKAFTIKTSELKSLEWCNVFGIEINSDRGVLIQRILKSLSGNYGTHTIIEKIQEDKRSEQKTKDAVENLFRTAEGWGLFSTEGTEIDKLLKRGKATILDLSAYTNSNIKALVVGIISKKLLNERIASRKEEELENIETEGRFFSESDKQENPLIWLIIDEAHLFLPKHGETPATDALVEILRQGRQPGISLILATQQPGEIHKDVLTQTDVVISHRLTNKLDLEALNSMMQSYTYGGIQKYMNKLPKTKGAAIVLDDNSERIYPIQIKPKRSWHGGESPYAVKLKRKVEL